ncbi:MAG TPA: TIGR03364 family FAD-dependent oxidoreductase [Bryobacteraceae bacterium]|jgi:FAD dependent oxidoreductase TIGR03364
MDQLYDVAVIGGGILGLAHAYVLARSPKRVAVFEREPRASGASVRNFGMVWPIGQPAGEMHDLALRSREIWLDMLAQAKLPFRNTGSLHLAYHADEATVLQEFADIGPGAGYACEWLNSAETLERSRAVVPQGLKGSLWSGAELTVDPRQILLCLPKFLKESGVDLYYGEMVRSINLPTIETTRGKYRAETAIICSGADFQTLYPDVFADSGLTRCKLQMMRTARQNGWELGPALAAGLTLRFYKAFRLCSTIETLKARIAMEKPEYDRWAIHILVTQTADGAITLGDSHEYGDSLDIFDKAEVDRLILDEARTFLRLPSWSIAEHWHGVYALHPELHFFTASPAPGLRILNGVGGSGMTLSFGLAERTQKSLFA